MGYTPNDMVMATGTRTTQSVTSTVLTTKVNVFAAGLKGAVPAPDSGGADAANFLRGDGTWQTVITSLANLNADNLTSGTIPDARFPATLPALDGSLLTNLNASNLASGTVPDACFPATLPALDGSLLTNLNASNLASGTVPDACFPATLPVISGANLTDLNASNITTGTLADSQLSANVALLDVANTFTMEQTVPVLKSEFGVQDLAGNTRLGWIDATSATNLFGPDNSKSVQIDNSAVTLVTADLTFSGGLPYNINADTTRIVLDVGYTRINDEAGAAGLSVASASISSSKDLLPSADATYKLGALGSAWTELHVAQIGDVGTPYNVSAYADALSFTASTSIYNTASLLLQDVATTRLQYIQGEAIILNDEDGIQQLSLLSTQNILGDVGTPLNLVGSEITINSDAGTAGQVLTSNGTGAAPTWQDATGGGGSGSQNLSTQVELWDDFLSAPLILTTPHGLLNLFNVTANSGTITQGTGTADHPGIAILTTQSNASSYAALQTSSSAILFGGGAHTFEAVVRIPTLSDGTHTYTVRIGFGETYSGEHVDGAFFRYTHSVNSGKFQCVTRSNNVETASDSGYTVVAGTWVRLGVVVNAAGTSVTFYVNGTPTATTHTTNIPTGTGRETAICASMVRSAGTAARTTEVDYMYWKWVATTPR